MLGAISVRSQFLLPFRLFPLSLSPSSFDYFLAPLLRSISIARAHERVTHRGRGLPKPNPVGFSTGDFSHTAARTTPRRSVRSLGAAPRGARIYGRERRPLFTVLIGDPILPSSSSPLPSVRSLLFSVRSEREFSLSPTSRCIARRNNNLLVLPPLFPFSLFNSHDI